MLQQGKEDIAVWLLILVSGKSLAQNYVDFLFKSVLNLWKNIYWKGSDFVILMLIFQITLKCS